MRRFRLWSFVIGVMTVGALCAGMARAGDGKNMIKNGDFENGVKHWSSYAGDFVKERDKSPEMDLSLAWEKNDTADKSKGALRMQLTGLDKGFWGDGDDVGFGASLTSSVKEDAILCIRLEARSIKGARHLFVYTPGAFEAQAGVKLKKTWNTYTVKVPVKNKSAKVYFTLGKNQPGSSMNNAANGSALLDNVSVSVCNSDGK